MPWHGQSAKIESEKEKREWEGEGDFEKVNDIQALMAKNRKIALDRLKVDR